MKRIILSILAGILFPILYVVIIGTIDDVFFPQSNIDTMQVYGQPSMGLILAPIAIPFWFNDFLRFHQYFGLWFYLDTVWFRVISTLGFNFSLYSILSYLLFRWLGWFKPRKSIVYQDPPNPPRFDK